ncbi:hypothetical protein AB0910_12530 [Streptomyces sp. NPDC047002]|uniref:hypothetical protein n=1 Tax=Streptomyces sp. NPDC047002 TaxID=3155475 RepID=UPI0034536F45
MEIAARITGRRGALVGLLSVDARVADSGIDGDETDALAVANRVRPRRRGVHRRDRRRPRGRSNGTVLRRCTDDHTGDKLITASLSRATPGTACTAAVTDPVISLTSDAVHDRVEPAVPEDLLPQHRGAPQGLADACVAPARADGAGRRDDAAAVVITREWASHDAQNRSSKEAETCRNPSPAA